MDHNTIECKAVSNKVFAERQMLRYAFRKAQIILLAIALLFASRSGFAQESNIHPLKEERELNVVLFTGSDDRNPFWTLFADYMQEAAYDLGIRLDVKYAYGDRKSMTIQVREVCQSDNRPDAIVVHSFKRTGPDVLQIADANNVPVFLVNSGLNEKEKMEIGVPRSDLKNWIGEMLPDDQGAGRELAKALVKEAKKKPKRLGPDGKVHVIALNGIVSHGASIAREQGLIKAIDDNNHAVLNQVITADWDQQLAYKRCRFLLRRYPHVSVIWCASDHMAVGAVKAVRDQGLVPGQDVIIGSVDATPEAMKLIEDGTLFATVGGHFQEGAWVIVLLHDYLRGVDFREIGTQFDSNMTLVVKENLEAYRAKVNRSTWEKTDFKDYSRYHTSELKDYPFDAEVRSTKRNSDVRPNASSDEK